MNYTVHTSQNGRNYQEDRYHMASCDNSIHLFAIMDGHGGSSCATFVSDRLSYIFKNECKHNSGEIFDKFENYIIQISHEWDDKTLKPSNMDTSILYRKHNFSSDKSQCNELNRSLKHSSDTSGCTFIGLVIDQVRNQFKILNIGDSRVIWKTSNNEVRETKDHKPYSGQLAVENVSGTLRIGGTLAVGRTIGDNTEECFGYVSHKPDVYTGTIVPKHTKFMLASDGIYDVGDVTSDFYTHVMELKSASDVFEYTKRKFKDHICKYTKQCTHNTVVLDDNTTVILVSL